MADQTYTYQQLQTAVTHVLAGAPNSGNPAGYIVNNALNWVVNQRAWSWRQRPLNIDISQIGISGVARSSGRLQSTTSTAHGKQAGYYVGINGTTVSTGGSLDGGYTVQSIIDVTNFYTAGTSLDTGGTISYAGAFVAPGQVAMPSDFSSIRALFTNPQSGQNGWAVDLLDLVMRRKTQNGATVLTSDMFYALSWLPQAVTTTEPTCFIHYFPALTGWSIFQGMYLRKLPALVNLTDTPDMPSQHQLLLYHACRAFAQSTEEEKHGEDWLIVGQLLPQFAADDDALQKPQAQYKVSRRHEEPPNAEYASAALFQAQPQAQGQPMMAGSAG